MYNGAGAEDRCWERFRQDNQLFIGGAGSTTPTACNGIESIKLRMSIGNVKKGVK
jgi:hypothetical protein